jgi:hypothetical protein
MTEVGKILRRTLDIKAMMNAGVEIGRDDLNAAELIALMVVEDETRDFEKELTEKR